MKLLKIAKMKIEMSKKHLLKYFYSRHAVILNQFYKCVLVIILTLFFNLIYEHKSTPSSSSILLLISVLGIFCFLFFFEIRHQKKVTESILPFLDLVIMSMSMGKSFGFAVKEVSKYQNSDIKPFYDEVFQKIFVLREPKSGFWVKKWDDWYIFLYELSEKKSMQLDQLRYFRHQWAQNFQNQNRKQALLAPIWIQATVLIVLFAFVQIWQFINGLFEQNQFVLVTLWYVFGLLYLFWLHKKNETKI